ncbi:hypothetical protein LCGC14_2112580 [marine sediment metagenome]|uniref:Uncharacterized protein n=1 Tax=marine sediment metagenome TaxID=412755 RepID=A0A0F9E6Q3_9ZZZZ
MIGYITFGIVISLTALAWRSYKRWEYRDKVRLRLLNLRNATQPCGWYHHPDIDCDDCRGLDRLLANVKRADTVPVSGCNCTNCIALRKWY